MDANEPYSYRDAGFSVFMRRSINNPNRAVASLKDYARGAQQQSRAINFDQTPLSGAMADVTKIGKSITLNGKDGRISIYDDQGNEVVRLGELDG